MITTTRPLSSSDVQRIIRGGTAVTTSTSRKYGQELGAYTFFAHGINQECATVEEALNVFKINWTVRNVNIKSISKDPEFDGIEFKEHFGLVREDTKFPLSTVGSAYKPVQNHECMEMIKKIVDEGKLVIESGGVFDNGRRVWVATRMPNPVEVNFGGEMSQTIIRYVHISWSHNSTQAITVSFMPYIWERKISLASYVPSGVPCSITFKHTRNAQERMSKGAEIMKKSLQFFKDAEIMLQGMAEKSLTPEKFEEMLNYLYPEPDEPKLNKDGKPKESKNSKIREGIRDRWEKLPADIQFTDFGAMVAVSEHSDFDGRTVVRGGDGMTEEQKTSKRSERLLDSSLFGRSQNNKKSAAKAIFKFDEIKEQGGLL